MKRLLPFAILLLLITSAHSQKRPLTGEDILKWNRITQKMISNDGNYVVYKTDPWKGDPVLHVSNRNGKELLSYDCGTNAKISADSKFVVFTIEPSVEKIRELKLKKTKKNDMPKNKLGIFEIETGNLNIIPNLNSFKIPAKWAGWIAYQTSPSEEKGEEGKEAKDDSNEGDKKKDKKESKDNGYILTMVKPGKFTEIIEFPFVTNYFFAEEGEVIVFETTGDDKDIPAGIFMHDFTSGSIKNIFKGKGSYKQLTINKKGTHMAFLADTTNEGKNDNKDYKLYYWTGGGSSKEILTNDADGIPENWEISANGNISFSKSEKRIFFGTAPVKPQKDTTILEDELPVLDVWHWKDPVLMTSQVKRRRRDENRTYQAMFDLKDKQYKQLTTKDFTDIRILGKGDSKLALESQSGEYMVQSMWEGSLAKDIYLLNLDNGEKQLIKKKFTGSLMESSSGKYLYWYNGMDSSWYTYNLKSREEFRITSPDIIQCANELDDRPDIPGSYRTAGWLENDESLLIYDRYDIWKVDPENRIKPIRLTETGRETEITYRLLNLEPRDDDFKGIDPGKSQYLAGHNEITRQDGFYKTIFNKVKTPDELLMGDYKLSSPLKAKDEDIVIFSKEDFEIFPDILLSDLSFKKHTRISHANPQQSEFLWGTAELVSWTSLDGKKLEGTLHKPENFDPNKKYPMIVNFYEKSSQGLFDHHIPERGRSTIGYHDYTSNEYLIFNPDVYYKTGYPGEDAFNCVMPGITALIEKGFVDEDAIAAQGHSWGGYQVAYLATRTNMFAAIESGAPVVNMFSAYGGIRWGSGANRSMQYEHGQSRIGKSIWEAPLRYFENSPIFTMDKVQTPILIMHNDDDGAVPWYQGIEYFVALRRLGKPVWMLNYNNADHWPTRLEDKHDFQIRLKQFFDHYLKGAPMPKWMKEGIPAVKKGVEFGYELER